jgi:hypothetical protein
MVQHGFLETAAFLDFTLKIKFKKTTANEEFSSIKAKCY